MTNMRTKHTVIGLLLLAAFTKSAQVPFHFWLPNAMEAPTPVSAYLHSATMVKAGVYLVARMTPVVGSTFLWTTAVTTAGAATMIVGAYRAVQERDLKRILAYSTLSALGVLMMLLGSLYPIGAITQGAIADQIGLRATTAGAAALLGLGFVLRMVLRPHSADAIAEIGAATVDVEDETVLEPAPPADEPAAGESAPELQ